MQKQGAREGGKKMEWEGRREVEKFGETGRKGGKEEGREGGSRPTSSPEGNTSGFASQVEVPLSLPCRVV